LIFLPSWQKDFIKLNLGPTLVKNGFDKKKLKLMILDDQLMLAPTWTKLVLSDPEAAKYVSGIAIHWYMNRITPRFFLDVVHKLYPQQFIISSEACEGFLPKGKLLIPFELTRMCCLLKKPYYFYFY